ncbi:hypothetical protein [Paraburkholderia sp. GAS32]|uniref:hypothetical protein n=1 Tax=Paraburkholderia sp. GAS32 TaxID=3035129 RepID=UPI003D1AA01E
MTTFGQKQPKELVPEGCTFDSARLLRFSFEPDSPDLAKDFYQFTVEVLAKMHYDHITISCVNGVPAWLTAYFRSLAGYGLPVEVSPAPSHPDLLAAIEDASRFTRFSWPAGREPFVPSEVF